MHVTPVNNAPVLSGVPPSAAFTPGGLAVQLSSVLSVTDIDNATLVGATVRVSGGTFLGDGDLLSVNGLTNGLIPGTTITAVYNAGSETLTLTGTDTKTNYQLVLEALDFRSTSFNPTNSGLNTGRTITWQLDDGSGAGNNNLSSPVTSQIFLHTLDLDGNNSTAPGTSFAVTYTEHGTPVPVADVDTVISDSDAANMTSATITLTNARATDLLSINGALVGVTASSYVFDAGSGTGVLTLSGSASAAAYQSALHQLVFSSNSGNIDVTDRDVAISVTDGLGIATNTAHATITIVAVNDPPTVDAHGGSLGYTENSAPTAIDPLLTLTDPDSAHVNSATVQFTGNFHVGEDVLGFTSQNGITGSYDATTGLLTLSGPSSIANYEAALKSVTYFNSSDNPSAQTRTISFAAVDDGGAASSVPGTATVSVTPVNDAPVMTGLNGTVGFTENGSAVVLSSGVVVSDVDSTLFTGAKVAITGGFVAGDTLNVDTTGTAVTASYNDATGVLTLSGQDTAIDYQNVLASVAFASTSDNPTSFGTEPTRTVTWSLTDLDQTSPSHANATGTVNTHVGITPVDDAPTVDLDAGGAGTGFTTTYTENATPIPITAADLVVGDPDTANLDTSTIVLTNAKAADSLSFAGALPGGIGSTIDTSVPGQITIHLANSASVADYQTAISLIQFSNSSDAPDTTDRDITVTVSGNGTGSNTAHAAVHVMAVNDPPVNTIPGSMTALDATTTTVAGLSVSDPDAVSLTTSLHVEEGILKVAAVSGGATVAGSGTATVTLSGSVAQIDATLGAANNVLYQGAFNFNGIDHLTMTSNDGGSSGTGGALIDTDNLNINVTPQIAAYQVGDIVRPALNLDASGHIILAGAAADFAATYGTKFLYAGVPAGTPFPPVDLAHADFHII
jgi:large repetitive protein